MQVLSVNISQPQTIVVNGKEEQTGYFKKAVNKPIYLGKTDVENDCVIDRIHHGGEDKACYLYGYNHYAFWAEKYPKLDIAVGLFGENITLEFLDEAALKIGAVFQIGEAEIQITQPRQPCYKMGVRFNNQKVVKQFRLAAFPGIYVRVLKEGKVKKGDVLTLIDNPENELSVLEVYRLIYSKKPSEHKLAKAMESLYLADSLKKYIVNKFK